MNFKFTEHEKELGAVSVDAVLAVEINDNYMVLYLLSGQMQIIYSTAKNAQTDYCKLTARMDEYDNQYRKMFDIEMVH